MPGPTTNWSPVRSHKRASSSACCGLSWARPGIGKKTRINQSRRNTLSLERAVTVHGANARTLYGFLGVRLIVVDEPAAVTDDMWSALATSAGQTRIAYSSAWAPSRQRPSLIGGPRLIARGSRPGVARHDSTGKSGDVGPVADYPARESACVRQSDTPEDAPTRAGRSPARRTAPGSVLVASIKPAHGRRGDGVDRHA